MISPGDLQIDSFTYELPPEKIALFPSRERDDSRLLICSDSLQESRFSRIVEHLPPDSLLVMNDTRVIHARLLFRKPTGARIEIFCLRPLHPTGDVQSAFSLSSPIVWECLVGNAKRWKSGDMEVSALAGGTTITLQARHAEMPGINTDGEEKMSHRIEFSWKPESLSFGDVIEAIGTVPLPPYIHREAEEMDNLRYQTVYAKRNGSIAAPTAGLHFTDEVFRQLELKGIQRETLSLHVGAGTFRPVSSATIGGHTMHPEPFYIGKRMLASLINARDKRLIAVGTTSVRSLESLYWFGVQLINGRKPVEGAPFFLDQWEPYETENRNHEPGLALRAVMEYAEARKLDEIHGITRLIIVPGYTFRLVRGMITNFHQPRSTLLLLVAAFSGDSWRDAYRYALDNDFRFLSYGDSCLFL